MSSEDKIDAVFDLVVLPTLILLSVYALWRSSR
jgi:hypothetical protein